MFTANTLKVNILVTVDYSKEIHTYTVMKLHILWSLTILCLASSREVDVCPWKRLADPCHPLGRFSDILPLYCFDSESVYIYVHAILPLSAHPDGSDITCGVEVKNCTGVPFQCRYVGPCPSDQCGTEGSRQGRAATAYTSNHWTGGVVPYAIRSVFSGEWGPLSIFIYNWGSRYYYVTSRSLLYNIRFFEKYSKFNHSIFYSTYSHFHYSLKCNPILH